MATKQSPANDQDVGVNHDGISPVSKELIIALVGYAGAGTSTAAKRIRVLLEDAGYDVFQIKFSALIGMIDATIEPVIQEGIKEGKSRFDRACQFQDRGDMVREIKGSYALASAAVAEIKRLRGSNLPGQKRLAFILDSLKHPDEVQLLREVYDRSFRLVAVHCDLQKRIARLIGGPTSSAKYGGVSVSEVGSFMDRDDKDTKNKHGQRVRDVFHLADFFLNNSQDSVEGSAMSGDIQRFVDLLLDQGLVRPTQSERAMYIAYASALQSSCLSRQVGAALIAADGRLVATGKNDPPKFGGGTYDEDSKPDRRCVSWEIDDGDLKFKGCHNDRKKTELYRLMADWMADKLTDIVAEFAVPPNELGAFDLAKPQRDKAAEGIREVLRGSSKILGDMPGVKDAIEYSRAIHAEMAALMSAARGGISTKESSLYVTVYPCHNCARHLVSAGVSSVYYVEPYVKSLAIELHSDSITSEEPAPEISAKGGGKPQEKMLIAPFTGVGPRMYEDFFVKRGDLKLPGGRYEPRESGIPFYAVRLRELGSVEEQAMRLVPGLASE